MKFPLDFPLLCQSNVLGPRYYVIQGLGTKTMMVIMTMTMIMMVKLMRAMMVMMVIDDR